MIATDVMTEIAEVLRELDGLHVYSKPTGRIEVPALLVPLPKITYDETYARGQDTYEMDLVLIAGPAGDRPGGAVVASRYTTGAGPDSVKAALDAHAWETCSEVTATTFEFADVIYNDTPYLGGVFATVIIGSGG